MDGYDDLYGDLYGDEEEQQQQQASSITTKAEPSTDSTKPAVSSPGGGGGAVKTEPISSLLAHEDQLQQQKHQALAAQQQQQQVQQQPIASTTTSVGEPLHFAPGYAQQRQQEGKTGGVRPSDMPDEGKMFIGGLNWDTTDDTLKSYFEQFGTISHCTIMRDVETGRSRGFAFLTFDDSASVNAVMAREHHLDGKTIDPKRAIPRQDASKSDKLFVRCLPASCTPESFRQYWRQFGSITDATLMMDKETGRHRGFGFVNYELKETVDKVLNNGPHYMDGNMLEVKRAQAKGEPKRPDYGVNTNMNTHYTPQPKNTMNNNNNMMMNNMNNGAGGVGGGMMNPMMGGGGGVVNPAMQGMGMGMGMGMGGMGNMGMNGMGGGGGGMNMNQPFDPQAMSKFFNQMGWGAWNPMMMGMPGMNGGGGGMGGMGGMNGMGMGMGMGMMGAPTGPAGGSMSPNVAHGGSESGGGGGNEDGGEKDSGNTSQFTAPMAAQSGGMRGAANRGTGMRGGPGGRTGGHQQQQRGGNFNAPSGPAAMRGGEEGTGPQRGRDNNQRFNPYSR
ncbi:hypothetical protein JCM3765_006868 [Sporobolomyces pararoseus]